MEVPQDCTRPGGLRGPGQEFEPQPAADSVSPESAGDHRDAIMIPQAVMPHFDSDLLMICPTGSLSLRLAAAVKLPRAVPVKPPSQPQAEHGWAPQAVREQRT